MECQVARWYGDRERGDAILFRKKCDCKHCKKLIEAKSCEKQALAQQEKMFLQEYERKQKVITWLIAENQALHKMLEERCSCNHESNNTDD